MTETQFEKGLSAHVYTFSHTFRSLLAHISGKPSGLWWIQEQSALVHSGCYYQRPTILGSAFFWVGVCLRQAILQMMADTDFFLSSLSIPPNSRGEGVLFQYSQQSPEAGCHWPDLSCMPTLK